MKHPSHQLQAYLDGALSATDQSAISGHLAVCQICRQEFESLQSNAEVIQATLDRLDPSVAEIPDPAHVFQAFQTRAAESAPSDLRPLWLRSLQMKFRPAFRPAGMGLAILALLAVLIGVVPVREAAANFLRLFRVQQITVISLDMAQSQRMQEIFEVLDAGLLGEPQVLRQPGEPLAYNNLTQASEAAGFRLLQPADLPERLQLAETTVVQGPHMRMTVERQALETLAAALQVDVGELSELDGTSVEVNVPVVVEQRYLAGEAQDGTLIFVQAPSPEVLISPDVDPAILGEIFLRLLGMSALEAR
ncbi:MAG TPA: zf-HC2 domain-containing protein, partial [Anaerolineales bacterium]